jgi:hypothetical protein
MMGSWGATLALITVRDMGIKVPGFNLSNCSGHRIGGLPAPADYLATFLVYAPLAMLEGSGNPQAPKLANILGWGWFMGVVLFPCLGTSHPTGQKKSTTAGAGKNAKTTGAGA